MYELWDFLQATLGLQEETLQFSHILWRATIVYFFLLILLRVVGDRRFSGQYAAIDVVLSIILGSTLSRGINGPAPFLGTLGVGLLLIVLHWCMSAATFYFPWLEKTIKGRAFMLFLNGELKRENLRHGHITLSDIASSIRLQGKQVDYSQISRAYLETSGKISVQTRQAIPDVNPNVLDVSVESGVQTIRIKLEK